MKQAIKKKIRKQITCKQKEKTNPKPLTLKKEDGKNKQEGKRT